jgi:hypothetical protein
LLVFVNCSNIGGYVIVILNTVRHVTFMLDTDSRAALILGAALGRDGEGVGIHAGSFVVIMFGATMSLFSSPFMVDIIPSYTLAAPMPSSLMLLVTSLFPSTINGSHHAIVLGIARGGDGKGARMHTDRLAVVVFGSKEMVSGCTHVIS